MNNYQLSIINYPLQEDSKLSIINSQLFKVCNILEIDKSELI